MADKIFANGLFNIKEVQTQYGPIIKMSINVSDFTSWMLEHQNEKGFVNIDVSAVKNPTEKSTHKATLNDFKPSADYVKPSVQNVGADSKEYDSLPF